MDFVFGIFVGVIIGIFVAGLCAAKDDRGK